MVRTKVTIVRGRPSWVLLSYNFLMLCPSSDKAKMNYFLDQSDTTAILNLVYLKFSTEPVWFSCPSQGGGTFSQKEDEDESLSKTWMKASGFMNFSLMFSSLMAKISVCISLISDITVIKSRFYLEDMNSIRLWRSLQQYRVL